MKQSSPVRQAFQPDSLYVRLESLTYVPANCDNCTVRGDPRTPPEICLPTTGTHGTTFLFQNPSSGTTRSWPPANNLSFLTPISIWPGTPWTGIAIFSFP